MSTARPAQVAPWTAPWAAAQVAPRAAVRAAVRAAFPRRRIATVLALLALVLQGVLPLAHNAAMRAAAAQGLGQGGIEQIVICTALGLRTIAVKDGLPVDTDGGSSKPQKMQIGCPLCHALGNLNHGLLPAGLLLALPAAIASLSFATPHDYVLPPSATGLPQARAPPLSR